MVQAVPDWRDFFPRRGGCWCAVGSGSPRHVLGVCLRLDHRGESYTSALISLFDAHDSQPLAYCIVGETSSTRLRAKTVGLSRESRRVPSPLLADAEECRKLVQHHQRHQLGSQHVSDEPNSMG